MKTFDYVIKDEQGIHARPAGVLVAEAKKYQCNATITLNGKSGDLKRIFAVMGLGVKNGDKVNFKFEGADEEAAYEAVKKLVEVNL